jgi:putative DNA primase/helicase
MSLNAAHRRLPDDFKAETLEIKRALADDAAGVVEALLGAAPCERRSGEARWNKRSFSQRISAPRRGSWRDYKSGEGGGLLDLISRETGCDFPGAIAWARIYLGGNYQDDPARRRKREAEDRAALKAEAAKAEKLREIVAGLVPIAGTPAEIYLRRRGIVAEAWPDAVAWSAAERACVFIGNDGGFIQRVMLDPEGRPVLGDDGKKRKLSLGSMAGGAVKFAGRQDGPLVLAEGPETALAVWTATGLETWSALGVVSNKIDLGDVPLDRLVIVAADDDAEFPLAPSMQALRRAVSTWERSGRRVVSLWPHETRRHDKSDFADLIAETGPDAVKRRYLTVLAPETTPRSPRGLPVHEAREGLGAMVSETINRLAETPWNKDNTATPPPAALIAAPLGLGKTEAAIKEALKHISAGLGPIVLATPTHALNAELRDRARHQAKGLGLDVVVEMWLGREADDPEAGDGSKMCLNLEAVLEIEAAGLSAEEHACKSGSARCALFGACAFQRQRAKSADLWLVSHAALGHTKPSEIPEPALLIVDENPLQALLRGTAEGQAITVGDADLDPTPRDMDKHRAWAWEADRRELVDMRRRLKPLSERVRNRLERSDLTALGITSIQARTAAAQAMDLITKPKGLVPGISASERRRLLEKASGNKARLKEASLYREMADLLDREDLAPATVRISRCEVKAEGGAMVWAWRIATLATIKTGWRAPTLLLDATARADGRDLLRMAFPGLRDDLGGEIKALAPHVRVTAIPSRKVSKNGIKDSKKLAREIMTFTATRLRSTGRPGRALLVSNKDMLEKLDAEGLSSPRVDVANFNALRGRDVWKDAPLAVIAGRTLPSPATVEFIAGVIAGKAIETTAGDWYQRQRVPVMIEGRLAGMIDRERHPDAMAEAVRWQICEAEIMQAIGRLRGVNRTQDNPAEIVLIGCPVPEEIELDAIEAWEAPTPIETMLAIAGIALNSGAAAAKAFPDLWDNAEAAKKALGRATREGHSLMETPYKEMSPTALAQLAGERRRPFTVLFDHEACQDPRAWIEAKLGPLARFDIGIEDLAEDDAAPILAAEELHEAPDINPPPLLTPCFQHPAWDVVGLPMPPGDLRQTLKRSGITFDEFARRSGLSRPHLSNALACRFRLSDDAATRLEIALAALPLPPPDLFATRH